MAERREDFLFSAHIDPNSLTDQNIQAITDAIARQLAAESSEALRSGQVGPAFHIRIGGEHSRQFSRTPEHRDVIHNNVIIGGGGPLSPAV